MNDEEYLALAEAVEENPTTLYIQPSPLSLARAIRALLAEKATMKKALENERAAGYRKAMLEMSEWADIELGRQMSGSPPSRLRSGHIMALEVCKKHARRLAERGLEDE